MITRHKSVNYFKIVIIKVEYQINIYCVELNCKKMTDVSQFVSHSVNVIRLKTQKTPKNRNL